MFRLNTTRSVVSYLLLLAGIGFALASPVTLQAQHVMIVNRQTGKALDVNAGDPRDGVRIIQFQQHGQANQQWKFIDLGSGWFELQCRQTGKVLDIPNGAGQDGVPVVQWSRNSGLNQQWRFIDLGSGWVEIQNRQTGKVLDIPNGAPQNGVEVIQWGRNSGLNQQWRIIRVD